MKQKRKGLWALFLSAALVIAQVPGSAAAQDIKVVPGNQFLYNSTSTINSQKMEELVAASPEQGFTFSTNKQPTIVEQSAWETVGSRQFVARTVTETDSLQVQIIFP